MELIEIKEILRKASVEVDIQGHGKHIALFETDFERVAIEFKKLTIPDVVDAVNNWAMTTVGEDDVMNFLNQNKDA